MRMAPVSNQVRVGGLNHRLLRDPDRGRARELLVVVALSALMLMPLLLYVWQSSEWVRSGYSHDRLERQRDLLVERNHQLRLEKASLESLARIEKVASEQLGLAPPSGAEVILVHSQEGKDVRRPRPAPASGPSGTQRAAAARSDRRIQPSAPGAHASNHLPN